MINNFRCNITLIGGFLKPFMHLVSRGADCRKRSFYLLAECVHHENNTIAGLVELCFEYLNGERLRVIRQSVPCIDAIDRTLYGIPIIV